MLHGQRVTKLSLGELNLNLVRYYVSMSACKKAKPARVIGEWVLVTAAAGSVGIAAVQIAKGPRAAKSYVKTSSHSVALGANVIAAAGSQAKIDIAKQIGGADYGVNYSKGGWQKEVLALSKGKGVDVIYDPVGLINGPNFLQTDIIF